MTSSLPRSAMPLSQVTFCVLDLETTGTDPGWDEITEVGAILVCGGERLGTFHTFVGPDHGGIGAVLASLVGFIGDAVITGHNISFDLRFLNAALARAERPLLGRDEVVDTMYLARALLRDDAGNCRLGTLAERFELQHRPSHRAFEDAAATVDLLHLLIERSSAFGVVGLDDLCALPALAGHKWAAKLRHTAQLPRQPGVYTCHDEQGKVVWVGAADDLRCDVRALFTKSGGEIHASVLRDTHGWSVHRVAASLERQVAQARLLHTHRPKLQRRDVVGEDVAYLCVESTARGVKTSVLRAPKATGLHLGPIASRARVAAAASGVRRLGDAGVDVMAVLRAGVDGIPDALGAVCDDLIVAGADDAVDVALARRDCEALLDVVAAHGRVQLARSFTGTLVDDEHHVAIVCGLLTGQHLPPIAHPTPVHDRPLHADLLAEVLLVAAALDTINAGSSSFSSQHGSAPALG